MSINEIISAYIEAKEAESKAKKTAASLKALILDHAGGNDAIETDKYIVAIKKTVSTVLDTKALYKDFPDIKNDYGRPSEKTDVIPTARPQTLQKTA